MITPMKHQLNFLDIVTANPRFGWFAEPGCGKTIGALLACSERPIKTVVTAPKSILRSAWARDAENFPGLRVRVLDSMMNVTGRKTMIRDPWDVLVTNYEMFRKYKDALLIAGARRLIVDESSKIRNPDAAITRATVEFADKCESVFLLSGTPAPNSFTEYQPQDRAVNGRTVRPYYAWCANYGVPHYEWVRVKGGQQKRVLKGYNQTPAQRERFLADLRKWSWALSKEECLDLPPQVNRVIDVPMNGDEMAAYCRAVDSLRLECKGGRVSRIRGEAVLGKLRQITGGAVYVGHDDVAEVSDKCSKLDALAEVADELAGQPYIVWFQFRHERDRLAMWYLDRGVKVAVIDGSTSDRAGDIAASFQRGEIPVLLCHPKAAAHGITLTRASHSVYYSLDFSYENWEQSRGRIHRAGMGDKPATYTVLLSRLPIDGAPERWRTVDHSMFDSVRRKGNQSDAVLDALRMVIGENVGMTEEAA